VCVCETIGDPSKLSVIRKSDSLGRIVHTVVLMCEEKLLFTMNQERELRTRPIYECRCDKRLKTKVEKSTRLVYTGSLGELEHLKIKTRLIDEMFESVFVVYYESRKREVKMRLLRVLGVSRRTPERKFNTPSVFFTMNQ
jgi:hypothetical protein